MRRGRILILLGLILAIGTAAAVLVILQTMGQSTPEIELDRVVVAIQRINPEEPVEGKVELADYPADRIPPGAYRSVDEVAGMLAAVTIPQGFPIHPDLLTTPLELLQEGELGQLVDPGFVAIAFPIDELSSVSYGIQPGDHIDILMTFYFVDVDQETQVKEPLCAPLCPAAEGGQETAQLTEQRPRLSAQLTLQDIRVLGVGRWNKEEPSPEEAEDQARSGEPVPVEMPKYITLMVTPQDALVLKLAREGGASIDMAIRAQDDLQQFTTQEVTLDYILARFGVTVPTKQPYSIDYVESARPQPEQ